MEGIQSGLDLLKQFQNLNVQPRQTGLIEAPPMVWSDPKIPVGQEFKHIYQSRLDQFTSRFGQELKIESISQVVQDRDTYCIRGIVKRLQFARVRAFQKKFQSKYDGESQIFNELDELELEDKTGKIKFYTNEQTTVNIPPGKAKDQDLPSGACLTIIGKFRKRINKFLAKQIFFPIAPPQFAMSPALNSRSCQDKNLLICSQPSKDLCIRIKDLIMNSCSLNITGLVLVGGFKITPEDITWIGKFIAEIKDYIDVFLLPSSNHERNRLFPLRPFSDLFFLPVCRQIALCSNPQVLTGQNGIRVAVSCGENVRDMMINSSWADSELKALEILLRTGHFCPTSPFSLKTEPFMEDHLVMKELPHIMISGKAKEFRSMKAQIGSEEVLMVAVPQDGMALVGLNGNYARHII